LYFIGIGHCPFQGHEDLGAASSASDTYWNETSAVAWP
jgi:hypothetical protein